jgi:hypothetical protein
VNFGGFPPSLTVPSKEHLYLAPSASPQVVRPKGAGFSPIWGLSPYSAHPEVVERDQTPYQVSCILLILDPPVTWGGAGHALQLGTMTQPSVEGLAPLPRLSKIQLVIT